MLLQLTRILQESLLIRSKNSFGALQLQHRRQNSNRSSTSTDNLIGIQLKSRSLIRLHGVDTQAFLQGLITNDVQHLATQSSIFALILNHAGRVLYDVILSNSKQSLPNYTSDKGDESGNNLNDTLLECDSSIHSQLIKHLTLYRIKKKVEIKDVSEQFKVWAVLDPQILHGEILLRDKDAILSEVCTGSLESLSLQAESETVAAECPYKLELTDTSLKPISDPRIGFLGWRIVVPSQNQAKVESKGQKIYCKEESEYKRCLYSLGVGEGVGDLPSGNCFPLESNGDLLHGINFHKGCYVGQELTARTHHTGVVRKRLMPFILPSGTTFPAGTDISKLEIINPITNRPVGKVRNIIDNIGLGLIRVEDALAAPQLKLNEHVVSVKRPFWWSRVESSSKENVTLN